MRIGSFSRTTHEYGGALGVIKPPDNNPGSVIPPELMDPSLHLTEAQQQDLAQRILDLYRMYQAEREYYATS